jgi:hypothetical protein
MIELRWLDRTGTETVGKHKTFWAMKVLQYRFHVHPDAAPASYESNDGQHYYAWSKWQDVPTARDASAP